MSTAITYGQLIQQVIRRLNNRDDLDQVAREFAVDRVDYYRRECFYDGRVNNLSIVTSTGVNTYVFPDGWEQVVTISLLNGVWLDLIQIPYDELDAMDVNEPSIQAIPTYWAPNGASFQLFPAPPIAYQLKLWMDLPASLPAESASNFWTSDAKSLVIEGTCAEVQGSYLHNEQAEARHLRHVARELSSLNGKTIRARGGIQIRGYL